MKKNLQFPIAVLIGLTIAVGILIVNSNVLVVPEFTNLQQNETEKEPVNVNPGITKGKSCEDSDGGLDYYTKGELTICYFETYEEPGTKSPAGCALHEDFCPTDFDDQTGKELWEYYCGGKELKFKKYTCPNGCQDGACIR
jgi:hypothetical protein